MITFFGVLFVLEVLVAASMLCIGCFSCHADTKSTSGTGETTLRRVA